MGDANGKQRERTCSKCRKRLPLDVEHFHLDASRKTSRCEGFSYLCKPCEQIRHSERHGTNPRRDRYRKMSAEQKVRWVSSQRKFRKSPRGRAMVLLTTYRRLDREKGRDCDLTKEFLLAHVVTQPCFYCGDVSMPVGCDRIDNQIGHTMTNVVPACPVCNRARADNFSHAEMLEIGNAIRSVKARRQKVSG